MVWVKELIDDFNGVSILTEATAIALNNDATILAVGAHESTSTVDYEYVFFLDPSTGDFKYDAMRYELASNLVGTTNYYTSASQFITK
jgi:hypothetical protein